MVDVKMHRKSSPAYSQQLKVTVSVRNASNEQKQLEASELEAHLAGLDDRAICQGVWVAILEDGKGLTPRNTQLHGLLWQELSRHCTELCDVACCPWQFRGFIAYWPIHRESPAAIQGMEVKSSQRVLLFYLAKEQTIARCPATYHPISLRNHASLELQGQLLK